ncbi:uncharacterized protein IUM83_18660 [Phytophthora cinnamomi]|uniref:uncharacterized protein n=1 Tax=Phytophthora cinnamomi TaxID=4785 RepID=UPI0035597AB8|nr:hypothetical protein IUM83_18660 [Phytophthora cinnamomi]
MSTFESYRSVNKGCAPNLKLQLAPAQRDQALRIRQFGNYSSPTGTGKLMGNSRGQLAKSKSSPFVDPVKSDSLIALGALAAFGTSSYGMLRRHWERDSVVQDLNERQRQEYQLKERERVNPERFENVRLFKIAAMGVLLALVVLALLYVGWFYLLLALVVVFSVMICAFS